MLIEDRDVVATLVERVGRGDAGDACADDADASLEDLFVEATLHGRGIGRALIEAVYARAKVAGAPCVYWHVRETNATAVRLYDKVASRTGHVLYRKDL